MDKLIYTYNDIHDIIANSINPLILYKPTMIVAIGGGGFIPGRILRTFLREKVNKGINMYGISVELYNDETNTQHEKLKKIQWFDDVSILKGQRVLLVDEVDDTRKTLQYCVDEIKKYGIEDIAVYVIHNKKKEKMGDLGDTLYFAGEHVQDKWIVYPWENAKHVNKVDDL